MGRKSTTRTVPRVGDPEASRSEALLRALLEETASVTGRDFFRSLARRAAGALGMRYAFAAECLDGDRARALAFWAGQDFGEEFEYELTGTPCANVVKGQQVCHYGDNLQRLFPEDEGLATLGAESYLGVPMFDHTQQVIGHLVLMNDKIMPRDELAISALETFASRAGAELRRQRADQEARQLLEEMEALLNVNRAVGRHLERDELFGALAHCLRGVVHHDRFGIELPIENDQLKGHLLKPDGAGPVAAQVKVLPRRGTACDWVLRNQQWLTIGSREEVRRQFPLTHEVMEHEGMESLAALPLVTGGVARGVLFFMAAARGAYGRIRYRLVEQVAAAVATALDNCLAHEALRESGRQALAASEERFRDLFDQAPIAYVHEGLDTRFIRANQTAMRLLGITPEEVTGTYGRTFIPDTPEAQTRLHEALESIGRGTDTSGVVLELRRKDNGKPLWIQWWSRPDPSGTYTRTMFLDITERVLMEREKARLEAQNTYLQEELRSEHNFGEIVGTSEPLRALMRQVDQVAPADSTVLVIGETGTGKELIARAIHERSRRRKRPLVKVNCGALSAGLVESELFGHVKGAFTGALTQREGRFKIADGGTLFLDEVGELPLETQVKLLRVLQEQEFEPLGSSRSIKVDVRIVAATNRDLGAAVSAGAFRRDLYYRLNVFPIQMPPLRERPADIPVLVTHFLHHFARRFGRAPQKVDKDTMNRLTAYAWPGNIRELQNVVERALLLSTGDTLPLPPDILSPMPAANAVPAEPPQRLKPAEDKAPAAPSTLQEAERRHIASVLAQTNWMIEEDRGAARILNLNPSTLRSRMQRLGIKRPGR